jgi:predicted NBD/HSP70 family sugar kinase
VLRAVLASPSPISRAGIASATTLNRSTVSRLVDELVDAGLLAEEPATMTSGRGRPGTPLLAGERPVAVGLQINATFMAARVVTLGGTVLTERLVTADLIGSEPKQALRKLARIAGRLLESLDATHELVGAGLAVPGLVQEHVLLRAPNLGWTDVDLAPLARELGLAGVALLAGNEANLAARTIATPLPGRPGPLQDFIYLSGEIGIGGAAVLGGRLLTGRHGWAGEIGHVCVDPNGPTCRCGSTGCLEQYAGRRALLEAAGLPDDADPEHLDAAVRDGDATARAALDRAAWALGVALAGAINVLDIPAIVLGGHLGIVAARLRSKLEEELSARVLSSTWVPPVVEVPARDSAPGATGAAYQVLDTVLDHPARWTRRAEH